MKTPIHIANIVLLCLMLVCCKDCEREDLELYDFIECNIDGQPVRKIKTLGSDEVGYSYYGERYYYWIRLSVRYRKEEFAGNNLTLSFSSYKAPELGVEYPFSEEFTEKKWTHFPHCVATFHDEFIVEKWTDEEDKNHWRTLYLCAKKIDGYIKFTQFDFNRNIVKGEFQFKAEIQSQLYPECSCTIEVTDGKFRHRFQKWSKKELEENPLYIEAYEYTKDY